MTMPLPRLTFFCELATPALLDLFGSPAVLEDLQALRASVSLALPDLSPGRAQVVRRLHEAGVPTVAWLLLPEEEGYWFNAQNVAQAVTRYRAFRSWTAAEGLVWDGVGLDIEPRLDELRALVSCPWRAVLRLVGRAFRGGAELARARRQYDALVEEIRGDGYRVDVYVIPLLLDARRAGSELLGRVLGLVDVPGDREVPMCYSSHVRPHGPGVLWAYGPEVQAIAVGSTGGGVDLGAVRPLDWEELVRDLRWAALWTDDIHVFSLEGCVEQGFLGRLRRFRWGPTPPIPRASLVRVRAFRRGLQGFLWVVARPWAAAVAGVVLALAWRMWKGHTR